MEKCTFALIAIVSALALLLTLEGVTFWNIMNPPSSDSGHPFLAGIHLLDVENITDQAGVANLVVRWTCWDDAALRIEYIPSNEIREIRVDKNNRFTLVLEANTHAQIQFFAYSYIKAINYTLTVNVYRDGSKDLGPWGIVP